jgi:hypothetical protein
MNVSEKDLLPARLWIDGGTSRGVFPQKSAGMPSKSFENFGRQHHVTPN